MPNEGEDDRLVGSRSHATAVLGVLDQGISSITNFGSAIAAALLLSKAEFGAFAIAYFVYAILVPGMQSIIGQELVLSTGTADERMSKARDALLFALVLGLIAAVGLAIVGLLVSSVRGPSSALAIALPLLQVQDTFRYAASLLGCMQLAVFTDISWLILGA